MTSAKMAHYRIAIAIILTIASIFSVSAQLTASPSCQSLTGMTNVSPDLLAGHWYEEFRSPAENISCVHVNTSLVNNQTQLNVTVMYSASKTGLLMDQFASAVINITDLNSNTGFNVTYNNSDTLLTFKIISTDYTSNIVLCGYTNETSFGIIATRNQIVNESWLMQLKDNASQILPEFNSTLGAKITQSIKCTTNSAASPVPALATFFTLFYALIKLTH